MYNNVLVTWHADPVRLWHGMRNRQRDRRRHRRRRAELRRLPGQLCGRSLRWRRRRRRERRVSWGGTAERLHLDGPQTLLPQPLLVAALQPALQEAAEAAEHDDDGPDQPEAGETGQEGVGALWHHHGSEGTGWEIPPEAGRGGFRRGPAAIVIRLSRIDGRRSDTFYHNRW